MFDYRARLASLRLLLKENRLDSLLVTNESNVTYLTGFTGHDSALLITPDSQFFLTDGRYMEEARETVGGYIVVDARPSLYEVIADISIKSRLKATGFESMSLPYEVAVRLARRIKHMKFIGKTNLVESLRAVKDRHEIELIKKSVKTAKRVLKMVTDNIRPGITESSLNRTAECGFLKLGASPAFSFIIAGGSNSSKPHAKPTDRKLKKNDWLMIDLGCNQNSYNSDMTRMVLVGNPGDRIREIYRIVRTAQERAIDKIRPGARISEIDACARDYISDQGYRKAFAHALGHGVGLDIHEEPSISPGNAQKLRAGMIFSVEPAIYIKGFGGVRIEDLILVTRKGCKILTR